jgi:hypothetical protein
MDEGDENPPGETVKSMGATEPLRRAAEAIDVDDRDREADDDE